MTVTTTYPDVYIREIPSGSRTITGVTILIMAVRWAGEQGPVWHLPNDCDRATRQLVGSTSRPPAPAEPDSGRMHPLVLRLVATVNPTVRELLETQYQFEEPFVVDSAKVARLGSGLRDARRTGSLADACDLLGCRDVQRLGRDRPMSTEPTRRASCG